MTKELKRRIKQNTWGNWYGYEGSRRVIEFSNTPFGTQEQYAQEWLERKENKPDSLNLMRVKKRVSCQYRIGPLLCTREATTDYKGLPLCAGCIARLMDKDNESLQKQ